VARVDKARAEWTRFENEDVPAFGRWMAAVFGALMTRSRELQCLIGEKEAIVREVDMEVFISGLMPHLAYQRVMYRRSNPAPAHRDAGSDGTQERNHDAGPRREEPDEVDLEMLFQDLLRRAMGINPDRLSDAAYERMFRDFKKAYGPNASEPPPPRAFEPSRPAPKPEQARIKEIYRILVRRLHPDLRADGDAAVSSIWHEVQEAYNAGDIDRLETLLALTDIKSNTAGDHTSLSQMRAVLDELARDLKALQKSLRRARKDDAWNFARAEDRAPLEARIRHKMEMTLADQEDHLRTLESVIRDWSQPRAQRFYKPQRAPRGQEEFSF
jgi:hypothetical protein